MEWFEEHRRRFEIEIMKLALSISLIITFLACERAVCQIGIDSARIIVTCYHPVEHHFRVLSCADSLTAFFKSIDTTSDQIYSLEVYGARWLTAGTLIRELSRFHQIEAITLSRMSTVMMDSVLSGLNHPELIKGVALRNPDSGPPPTSMFRFRNVESAWLEFRNPDIICGVLREWQALERLTYIGFVDDLKCQCETKHRQLKIFNDTIWPDHDQTFITTGMYQYSTAVGRLLSDSWKLPKGIIPLVGVREYIVRHQTTMYPAHSSGIIDRFLAVLVARAQHREKLFDVADTTVNTQFLTAIADTLRPTEVQIEADKIVLLKKFVYRGSLVAVMRRLLEEGCV
jgi:hypothetical protein